MNPAMAALLEGVRIDGTTRGLPPLTAPLSLSEVGARGWTLDDLQPPFMVLRRSALEHNVALMAAYGREHDLELAPHGKTTMAPQLWHRQLEAGAWGLSAATAAQARVMRAAGVRRILLANELADAAAVRWAAADLAGSSNELLCYVDSERGLRLLEDILRDAGAQRRLPVLVELGHANGRTGCRGTEEAIGLARLAASSGAVDLAGVAGFEGTIGRERDPGIIEQIRSYLRDIRSLAERLLDEGLFAGTPIVTAGGSLFFDLVVEELGRGWPARAGVRLVLRPGSYATHDDGMYERSSPFASNASDGRFRAAIRVWGTVLSTPEAGLALIGLGRRDVPWDQGYPRVMGVRRERGPVQRIEAEATGLDDQHLYCRVGAGVALDVGDLVVCGVSHPCTALDRWRVIPVLDDDDRVVEAVATFF